MDLEEVKKLIKIVEKSGIKEIEIEEDGKKIRISKGDGEVGQMQMGYAPVQHHMIPQAPSNAPSEAPKAEVDEKRYHDVTSQMVGTFYRAPSEDAAPFVKEGDVISAGQTLCIIEAMKLMNEIESDVSGRIVKIIPDNGAPVEFGEVLFKVEPV